MGFKKRNESLSSIEDILEQNSGMSREDFFKDYDRKIPGMDKAAELIRSSIRAGKHITIVGDYDVDGVTSSSILFLILNRMGVKPTIRLPRRFSEGYGLSMKIVEEIESGLVITVDNGITAIEQIRVAKEKGLDVIILDHHLSVESGELPPADIIIDPEALKNCEFLDYCGAGLAYKLAQEMFPDSPEFLALCRCHAAVGTVADVVSLVDENRTIVRQGLKDLISPCAPFGLSRLIQALGMFMYVDSDDIAFGIGPVINACGRLLDDGAFLAFCALNLRDKKLVDGLITIMLSLNEKRKEMVAQSLLVADDIIMREQMQEDSVKVLYLPHVSEGVVGIIAGKIAETYGTPAFVLTDAGEDIPDDIIELVKGTPAEGLMRTLHVPKESSKKGILKGSGRSNGKKSLKEILDAANDNLLLGYGGHAAAAGLSMKAEKLKDFHAAVQPLADKPEQTEDFFYDIDIKEEEIPEIAEKVEQYGPYGEGFRPPVFHTVIHAQAIPEGGHYKIIGGEGLKFLCKNKVDALLFRQKQKYYAAGEPKAMEVIGQVSKNYFEFKESLYISEQIIIDHFVAVEKEERQTDLAARLMSLAKKR